MLEKFKPQRETPIEVNARHFTTFTMGCESCPSRREICAPSIGRATLNPGTMPIRVAIDVELKMTIGNDVQQSTERISEVILNETDCSNAQLCRYEDDIARHYAGMAGDPSLLNAQAGIFPNQENDTE